MQVRTVVLMALLLPALPAPSWSQTVAQQVEVDVRNAVKGTVGAWIAPFQSTARDWLFAGGAIAASALVLPWDDDIDRWLVRNRSSSAWSALKEVREGGAAFTGRNVTPVLATLYVVALASNSRDVRDAVFGCASSYLSGSVVRHQIFYRFISRERPDSSRRRLYYAPPAREGDQYRFGFPGGEWGDHSFPAGHVANIAACASFLNHRFSMGFVEPMLYVVAVGVGLGRLVDRRHWTSDTVLGAFFGYAIGKDIGIRSLHQFERDRAPQPPVIAMRGLYLLPSHGGWVLGWGAGF